MSPQFKNRFFIPKSISPVLARQVHNLYLIFTCDKLAKRLGMDFSDGFFLCFPCVLWFHFTHHYSSSVLNSL